MLDREGVKDDEGKVRMDLLPLGLLQEVARVLEKGAEKYSDDGWQKVPNFNKRYMAALLRHLTDWQAGRTLDKETGLSHMAHVVCNALFLLWGEGNGPTDE